MTEISIIVAKGLGIFLLGMFVMLARKHLQEPFRRCPKLLFAFLYIAMTITLLITKEGPFFSQLIIFYTALMVLLEKETSMGITALIYQLLVLILLNPNQVSFCCYLFTVGFIYIIFLTWKDAKEHFVLVGFAICSFSSLSMLVFQYAMEQEMNFLHVILAFFSNGCYYFIGYVLSYYLYQFCFPDSPKKLLKHLNLHRSELVEENEELFVARLGKFAAKEIGVNYWLCYVAGRYSKKDRKTKKELPAVVQTVLAEHYEGDKHPTSKEAAIVSLSILSVATLKYLQKQDKLKQVTMIKLVKSIFRNHLYKGKFDDSGFTIQEFIRLEEAFATFLEKNQLSNEEE